MKKCFLLIAALGAMALGARAQDVDFESLGDLNTIELSKAGSTVETELNLAFPMYFGVSALTNVTGTFDTQVPKNFVYGLQLADMRIRYNALDVSLGLRWTFMDFTFANSDYSILKVGEAFTPYSIKTLAPDYDGKKSKIHASYFGVPLRVGLNFGKAKVYAGASAELLTGGYTKFKRPKTREKMEGMFNPFRATIEGGFSYGSLGVFVMYGLTPLFSDKMYAQANTITFGLLLGL